jgi:hypothetical protein
MCEQQDTTDSKANDRSREFRALIRRSILYGLLSSVLLGLVGYSSGRMLTGILVAVILTVSSFLIGMARITLKYRI